tara:strand:+ start:166 stop:1533 length:1368 start_codon:yes stop_codon:yes gene_type:complete
MSQNDLSIANQGFASFRSDLNSALQALGSTNSGTSAPSTTYANQLFYDTTNNILKIRNEDNDAFISLFTLDQTNDNIEALTIDGTLTYNGDLVSSTAGTSNFRAGVNAGNSIASGGNFNVCVGDEAGTALTTGDNNVAVGFEALKTEDTTSNNTAVGYASLETMNGGSNTTAVGFEAGASITTGSLNTIFGYQAGDALTDADRNTALGYAALTDDTLGSRSVAVGYRALSNQNFTSATNSYNTAMGYLAGYSISTGEQNVIIGGLAGDAQTTANRQVIIGYNANGSSNTSFDEIVIGNNVTGSGSSAFTFGTGAADSAIANGSDSISIPSDERYKEEIATSTAGLGFINDLRPVTFKWKMEKDVPSDQRAYVEGSEKRVMNAKDDLYHGFIAQEVKTVLDNHSEVKNYDELWSENADGRQRLGVTKLIPMLVKSIQELSEKNDALEARVKTLEGS